MAEPPDLTTARSKVKDLTAAVKGAGSGGTEAAE